ncbi:DUF4010 domain-containing protein [Cupriavidus basilensis]
MVGHVAMRLTGSQRGIMLTGLLGGLASSTAATLTLARFAKQQPSLEGGMRSRYYWRMRRDVFQDGGPARRHPAHSSHHVWRCPCGVGHCPARDWVAALYDDGLAINLGTGTADDVVAKDRKLNFFLPQTSIPSSSP